MVYGVCEERQYRCPSWIEQTDGRSEAVSVLILLIRFSKTPTPVPDPLAVYLPARDAEEQDQARGRLPTTGYGGAEPKSAWRRPIRTTGAVKKSCGPRRSSDRTASLLQAAMARPADRRCASRMNARTGHTSAE